MPNSRIFTALLLCFILVLASTAGAVERPVNTDPATGERLVRYSTNSSNSATPSRDVDEFMTLRYMFSSDGGANWSEAMGTGDHGMLDDDGESNWGGASYDFGSVVDNDNNLRFVVVLNAYNEDPELNPSGRENGLYDVSANTEGEATYTMITAEGDMEFWFSDCGKDADGNLYAVWAARNLDEDGAAVDADLYVARTTDGAWGDPVLIAEGLDATDNYPHMTQTVGENFYVIYEMPNAESGLFDHYVVTVPSSLEGEATISNTGVASGVYYSYYIGSVDPIAQDVADSVVYFTVRNADQSATAVAHSSDGAEWEVESIAGAQRYPSMGMDEAEATPYVFSNAGVPDDSTNHHNWYSFDGFGYDGGDWQDQISADELLYYGGKWLLYCHNGVWTPSGSFVRGCNAWGAFTPDGYVVSAYDGDAWSDPMFLWSIYDDGDTFVGGNITQNQLNAGTEDYVWLAFCGMYGESDFDGPVCASVAFSSVMLEDDNVVTALVEDALSGIDFAMMNWAKVADGYGEEYTDTPDSTDVDDDGNGYYYFTLPDSVTFTVNDSTTEMRILESGDEVYFYADAYDGNGLYGGQEEVNTWIVDESVDIDAVPEEEVVPFSFELGVNYPNPFNNSTMIPFSLNRAADVKVSIFDISGRLVETLFDGRADAGNHTVAWHGEGVSSGIYLYTLETAGVRHVAKMTLVR